MATPQKECLICKTSTCTYFVPLIEWFGGMMGDWVGDWVGEE